MLIKKILLCTTIFIAFNYNYYTDYNIIIPRFNLDISFKLSSTLNEGLSLFSDKLPFIISGHSGIGPLALFNYIEYLDKDDEIIIYHGNIKYYYKLVRRDEIKKGSYVMFPNNKNYLYLITCDKKDLQKQLIITAKNTKNVEI